MVLQMIDLNPSLRPTFNNLLSSARGTAFPTSFYDFYHTYVHSVEELPSPSPFSTSHPSSTHGNATHTHPSSKLSNISAADGSSTPTSAHPPVFSTSSHVTTFSHSSTAAHTTVHTSAAMGAGGTQETQGGRNGRNVEPLPRNSDRRIDAIWEEFDAVVPWLNLELREHDENTNPNLGTVADRSGDRVSNSLLVSCHCLRSCL
jgi:phosphoinositide-3-kinase regulatory subunit 4